MADSLDANISTETSNALEELSKAPKLLVACDFDGTLAPICDHPDLVEPNQIAMTALRQLSELPLTTVSVISGRSLADLCGNMKGYPGIRLVGSHGAEFDIGIARSLTDAECDLYARARLLSKEISTKYPGSWIEEKPHSIVFHTRPLAPEVAVAAEQELAIAWNGLQSGYIRSGKRVLEFLLVAADKGQALRYLSQETLPSLVLFAGDDLTDEDGFAYIGETGWSIKVGLGDSIARLRMSDVDELAVFLAKLAEARRRYFRSYLQDDINKHVFLSDNRSFVLLDSTGSVAWQCFPRLDSMPLFSSLVAGPVGGTFRVSQKGELKGDISYLKNSLISKTQWSSISVTDFLDVSEGRAYQKAGRSDLFRVIKGTGTVKLEFCPSPDFGRMPIKIEAVPNGLKVIGGSVPMTLVSPDVIWCIDNDNKATSEVFLEDSSLELELRLGTGSSAISQISVIERIEEAQDFSSKYLSKLQLPNLHREHVAQSALALRGLVYLPTGAIAAAATTSLPEAYQGSRNWDYRFCWPRDACIAASALLRLGDSTTGLQLLDWITTVVEDLGPEEFIAPLYSVTGRPVAGEAEVSVAQGYHGSRPVRLGNLASLQLQLDSVGPILDLIAELGRKSFLISSEHFALAERLTNWVVQRWQEPDHGIWEFRMSPRHYTHSKIMCWHTIRCFLELSKSFGINPAGYFEVSEQIRLTIENEGYRDSVSSYVAAFDLEEPDSALCFLALTGFHPPKDPRLIGTIDWIGKRLSKNNLVYRYLMSDGLEGKEGAFLICGAWYGEALSYVGRVEEAHLFLQGILNCMSSPGLLSEQWDIESGRALGNYPQAFSHAGLINLVCSLDVAPN